MIKFFRNIRHIMIKENKLSKYLLYAIGEIILVVIGILIALKINNYNEKQKNDQKVYTILRQVQKELETNIVECDQRLQFYMQQDSIAYLVLNKQVSPSDYMGEQSYLFISLLLNHKVVTVQKNAYDNLLTLADQIPEPLDSIFLNLKKIYTEDLELFKGTEEDVKYIVFDNYDWLKSNVPWFHKSWSNEPIGKEEMDYYLKNDYYLNKVTFYRYIMGSLFYNITRFRFDTFKCYRKITEQLHMEEDLIKDPPPFYYVEDKYTDAIGTYQGTFKDSTITFKILSKNNELFLQENIDAPINLITLNPSQYILYPDRWMLNLTHDEQHHVTEFAFRQRNNLLNLKLKKVE